MSRKKSFPAADTMQLGETDELTADLPEEESFGEEASFEEVSADADTAQPDESPLYAKTEKALTGVTGVLSAVLIIGSLVFWVYFLSRLLTCPGEINNWQMFRTLLIGCVGVNLVLTVIEAVLRKPVSLERWMFCMCASGAVTALITIISDLASGGAFDLHNALVILCFAVSGSALPAAVFGAVRYLINLLCGHIRSETSKDRETVYSDVCAQCRGEF